MELNLLLLIGLVGLIAYTVKLASRVNHLEEQVRLWYGEPPPVPDPLFEGRPAPEAMQPPPRPPLPEALPERPPVPELEPLRGQSGDDQVAGTESEVSHETLGGFFERWVGGRLMIW